jgi:hypothetical protein
MNPNEVRKRLNQIRKLWSWHESLAASQLRHDLMIEVLTAIADGRCTDPQICAREIIAERAEFT